MTLVRGLGWAVDHWTTLTSMASGLLVAYRWLGSRRMPFRQMVQTHRVFFSVALTLPIAVGIGALGQNLAEWGFGRTKVYVSIDREHVTRGNALWKLGTSSATSKTQDAAFRAAAEEYRGAFESDVVSAYPGVSAIHKLWGDALWNLAHEKGLEWHVVSEALLEA